MFTDIWKLRNLNSFPGGLEPQRNSETKQVNAQGWVDSQLYRTVPSPLALWADTVLLLPGNCPSYWPFQNLPPNA